MAVAANVHSCVIVQRPPGGVGLKKIIQEGCTIDVERDSRLFKKLSFLAVLNFSLLIDTMC